MQQSSPTGSVSDRHGWEWSRLQTGQGDTQAATPDQPTHSRNPQQRIERLEQEVHRLREELEYRDQQQAEIVRQYELCLAQKNRELTDQSGDESLVERLLDPLG